MRWLMLILILIFLSGCTTYTRRVQIYVEDGGTLTIGDIEILAEIIKGDEQFTTTPNISPTLEVPLL